MRAQTVRTTLALPVDLLEATDKAVREGKARSRNEFVAAALRRELAAHRRAEIDAAFADVANDVELQEEVRQLEQELAGPAWEAFLAAEAEYHGPEYQGPEEIVAEYRRAEPAEAEE